MASRLRLTPTLLALAVLSSLGCTDKPSAQLPSASAESTPAPPATTPPVASHASSQTEGRQPTTDIRQTKKVQVGKNVWLEVEGAKRRVVFNAQVCFREGPLEQLLCRKNTKEHEAILAADVDARDLHRALLLTGAKEGSPVRHVPKFAPPSGTPIRVMLRYENEGKTVTIAAQEWIRDRQTQRPLDQNWVFAGSVFFPDTFQKDGPPLYGANGGDVICVSNFEDAMLDLPINSSKDNSDLEFEAWTNRIPELESKVVVFLEPILPTPKK